MPAHLQSGDFESSLIGQPKKPAAAKPKSEDSDAKEEPEEEEGKKKEEDDDDDEESSTDGDWNSEDDPDRLWCVCQQPHNNRFMICCDTCLDWYHGKCVGITKKMGKDMESEGNEWRCPKCKKNEQEAREEKQKQELAEKLKEREETRRKSQEAATRSLGLKKKVKRSDSSKSLEGKETEKVCKNCVESF